MTDPGSTARRLDLLMEANGAILAERSLGDVLHRIVAASRELVSARYAALGVLAPDGSLEQFVHEGLDGATVCPRMIVSLPPLSFEPGSVEYFFARAAKSPPALILS